ncbi:hypothetical protein HDU89_008828 [Geranomyces variabilis]|nr:hypothetical protein HDU89_008828 [Geranomyces variabilis]
MSRVNPATPWASSLSSQTATKRDAALEVKDVRSVLQGTKPPAGPSREEISSACSRLYSHEEQHATATAIFGSDAKLQDGLEFVLDHDDEYEDTALLQQDQLHLPEQYHTDRTAMTPANAAAPPSSQELEIARILLHRSDSNFSCRSNFSTQSDVSSAASVAERVAAETAEHLPAFLRNIYGGSSSNSNSVGLENAFRSYGGQPQAHSQQRVQRHRQPQQLHHIFAAEPLDVCYSTVSPADIHPPTYSSQSSGCAPDMHRLHDGDDDALHTTDLTHLRPFQTFAQSSSQSSSLSSMSAHSSAQFTVPFHASSNCSMASLSQSSTATWTSLATEQSESAAVVETATPKQRRAAAPKAAKDSVWWQRKTYVCDFKTTNVELYRWHTTHLKAADQKVLAEARAAAAYAAVPMQRPSPMPLAPAPNASPYHPDPETDATLGLLRHTPTNRLVLTCPAAFAVRSRLSRHINGKNPVAWTAASTGTSSSLSLSNAAAAGADVGGSSGSTRVAPRAGEYCYTDDSGQMAGSLGLWEDAGGWEEVKTICAKSETESGDGDSQMASSAKKAVVGKRKPFSFERVMYVCSWPACGRSFGKRGELQDHVVGLHGIAIPVAREKRAAKMGARFGMVPVREPFLQEWQRRQQMQSYGSGGGRGSGTGSSSIKKQPKGVQTPGPQPLPATFDISSLRERPIGKPLEVGQRFRAAVNDALATKLDQGFVVATGVVGSALQQAAEPATLSTSLQERVDEFIATLSTSALEGAWAEVLELWDRSKSERENHAEAAKTVSSEASPPSPSTPKATLTAELSPNSKLRLHARSLAAGTRPTPAVTAHEIDPLQVPYVTVSELLDRIGPLDSPVAGAKDETGSDDGQSATNASPVLLMREAVERWSGEYVAPLCMAFVAAVRQTEATRLGIEATALEPVRATAAQNQAASPALLKRKATAQENGGNSKPPAAKRRTHIALGKENVNPSATPLRKSAGMGSLPALSSPSTPNGCVPSPLPRAARRPRASAETVHLVIAAAAKERERAAAASADASKPPKQEGMTTRRAAAAAAAAAAEAAPGRQQQQSRVTPAPKRQLQLPFTPTSNPRANHNNNAGGGTPASGGGGSASNAMYAMFRTPAAAATKSNASITTIVTPCETPLPVPPRRPFAGVGNGTGSWLGLNKMLGGGDSFDDDEVLTATPTVQGAARGPGFYLGDKF